MAKIKITRRRFVASTAASAALIAAPYVRGAHAAGKLSIGFWDHWVPGANKATETLVERMGGEGEGRGQDRLHHLAGQQEPADHRRRGAGASPATTSSRCRPGSRTSTPSNLEPVDDIMGELIKQNGAVNGTVEYLGKIERQVDRRAGDRRQPDQGPVLAHRPDEAARRHRHPGDVSGRRGAQGRRLDPRHLPQGRRSLPQGRRAVRHRARHDHGLGRHGRRVLPCLRRRAGRREGQHHRQVRRGAPGARVLQEAGRSSCRRTRRPGTTPPTTSGWCPARAR